MEQVAELRCLGAIGVVEMKRPVEMGRITEQFVDAGVWVRPFGRLVYLMPAYLMSNEDLERLCRSVVEVVARQPD
jgi:adenosylmethionine---8-amino-7-oxononanoate aminotransferase